MPHFVVETISLLFQLSTISTELKPKVDGMLLVIKGTMNLVSQIVPAQKNGLQTKATSKQELESRHAAVRLFGEACERLADVNNWYSICGKKGAEFQLTDKQGKPVFRKARKGDLIRISLPAPPGPGGDGFDWVEIETFEEIKDQMKDQELYAFRVRPIANPLNSSPGEAHFYASTATSTFLVLRVTNTVYAMERGKNEPPNNPGGIINRVRNFMGAIPAMLGLSKPQWKLLTDSLLKAPMPKP